MLPRYLHAVGTLLIGLALIAGVIVGGLALGTGGQPRTLAVSGTATRRLTSDQSVVTGTWRESAKTAAAARQQVEEQAAAGLAAVKETGISDADLKTLSATVYPEYDYTIIGRQPKVTGYVGETMVEVRLTDTSLADAVLAVLTEKGATTAGPNFGLSPESQQALQKELKVAAVTDARNQAEALAREAGGRLGKVLSVTGGDLNVPGQPIPLMATDAAGAAEKTTDLQPGANEVTVSVTVTYQLR